MTKHTPSQALQQQIDALVEFVHRGGAPLLDVIEVIQAISPALHPNCCANFEYRFAWNDDCDPDDLDIDWKRLKKRILQRVVKSQDRMSKIQAGARMTAKEKQAYRLELARKDYGYKTAQERLESNDNCKWVDLSYVADSQGRRIYVMEMGDADCKTDDEIDAMLPEDFAQWHEDVWHWKKGPLSIFGPFRSEEEAEVWMGQKGAFSEEDE